MCALLNLDENDVFSAYYIPFRSPSWAELDRKQEAETFAQALWRRWKERVSFERIVCVGKDRPGKQIADLFDAAYERSFDVGWGRVAADRYRLPDGRSLVALPHLSRYTLFGRAQGDLKLRELFEL
jgi:hypothetical protein